MVCQTWSAAVLFAGVLSRQESTSSQSLKERPSGPFCCTACAAMSHCVGASLMLATKSGGGAVCDAAEVTRCCQSSRLPWYFLYREVMKGAIWLTACGLFCPWAMLSALAPYQKPSGFRGLDWSRAIDI